MRPYKYAIQYDLDPQKLIKDGIVVNMDEFNSFTHLPVKILRDGKFSIEFQHIWHSFPPKILDIELVNESHFYKEPLVLGEDEDQY